MVQDLLGEYWVEIDGYPGYHLSNMCRVKSLAKKWFTGANNAQKREKDEVLLVQRQLDGYYYVQLRKNNVAKFHRIHRLMALHFIPNIDGKPHVNHLNGNRGDNRIENLEWCTHSENIKHAYRTKLRGEQKRGALNKLATSVKCCTLDIVFGSMKEASDSLGIGQGSIISVCVGRRNHTYGMYFKYVN